MRRGTELSEIVIDVELMRRLTAQKDRNMYIHPNPVARAIFWSRLRELYRMLLKHGKGTEIVADVGGGSGAFLPGLSALFKAVEVLDLDCSDAGAIKTHFDLTNVTIRECDIFAMSESQKYDVFVFADVLEHFYELSRPLNWIQDHAKSAGALVAVSLPTENALYELGRKVLRKQKPLDHYHGSAEVIHYMVRSGFNILESTYVPRFGIGVPLFQIALLTVSG
jgi:2-polyprenyl-3-methyl-5-hydroxy-6-metoxy-1,4-benzoquinol methylase